MSPKGLASLRCILDPWGLLGLFTAAAFLVRGYGFGREDQNLYLPFVLKWSDPSLFPHDYLLSLSFARESVVWRLLAVASRWIPLQALLFLLTMLTAYGGLLFVYKIALHLWKDRLAAWLAVALWVPAYTVPGVANTTFDDYFTTRILGTLFGLSALYWFFTGQDRRMGGSVFLGGLCHVISLAPFGSTFAFSGLLERRWRRVGWAGGGLLAAAGVLVLSGAVGKDHALLARYDAAWFQLATRAAPELFPQRWSEEAWLALASVIGLFPLLWMLARRSGADAGDLRRALHLFIGQGLLSAAALVGTSLRLALAAQLCLFRGWAMVMLLEAVLVSGVIVRTAEGVGRRSAGKPSKSLRWAAMTAAALALALLWLGSALVRPVRSRHDLSELRAMEMVKALVPKDATVIVPPDWEDFRLRAERSSFVTFKDRGPSEFDRAYAVEWHRRILWVHGLKPHTGECDATLEMTPAEILAVGQAYRSEGLRYLVTRKSYGFVLLGCAGRWRLYDLQEKGGEKGAGTGSACAAG